MKSIEGLWIDRNLVLFTVSNGKSYSWT